MLLRNSISTTKKFFQKTIQSVKSFFSTDHYQKLPKTTPPHSSSSTLGIENIINAQTNVIINNCNKDLDNFYNAFTDRWDDDKGKEDQPKRRNKKMIMSPSLSTSSTKQERDDHTYACKRSGIEERMSSKESTATTTREGRSWLVAQKLKELQKMDVSNVEHALDIEEVLHYYSRLTCPAYLDMVDKFFMEMYAEFFGPPPVTPRSNVRSRPRLRSVRT